jgi:SAM-dependent methyltransferase
VADVQKLPFEDGQFDCVLAGWMLYHVPNLDQGLRELRRVLRPGGRLVATTVMPHHLHELGELLGGERPPPTFNGENGADLLGRHFERVERRDAFGSIVFPSRVEAQTYVDSTIVFAWIGNGQLPDLEGPVRVTSAPVVFVAEAA